MVEKPKIYHINSQNPDKNQLSATFDCLGNELLLYRFYHEPLGFCIEIKEWYFLRRGYNGQGSEKTRCRCVGIA